MSSHARKIELESELIAMGSAEKALLSQRYFKTGKGEYAEKDSFLGISTPIVRRVAKEHYRSLNLSDFKALLNSKWHEIRLAALHSMVMQFKDGSAIERKNLYKLYISSIGIGINNWDLIDSSADKIVGAYSYDSDRDILDKLADGEFWQKRVAVVSTFYYLRKDDPTMTYKLCEKLVSEKADLLQKVVGWALREMGKKSPSLLVKFLDIYASTMPRTMLRYSIERFPKDERLRYMSLKLAK